MKRRGFLGWLLGASAAAPIAAASAGSLPSIFPKGLLPAESHLYLALITSRGDEYARQKLERSAAAWSIDGWRASNAKQIDFPECPAGYSALIDRFSVIDDRGRVLVTAHLSGSLGLREGIQPSFAPGALVFEGEAMEVAALWGA